MSNCYAWYAREFARGYWNSAPIAALPPLNIFLGGILAKTGMETYHCLIFLSTLFYGLTIFPLYGLLKRFVSSQQAAWGCMLFILAPKLIRFSAMGLLESTRDFFLVSAFYFLFQIWDSENRKNSSLLFFGACLGLLSLARGEGIFMAGVLGLALMIRPLQTYCRWQTFSRQILLPMLVAAGTALLVMSPRIIHNYHVTGYPVTDTRMIEPINFLPGATKIFHDKRNLSPRHQNITTAQEQLDQQSPAVRRLKRLPRQILRGGYELYMILAIFGIFALYRKRQWKREYTFLITYCFGISISFIFFAVSYRYFIFFVPLFMVFTLNGLTAVHKFFKKFHQEAFFYVLLLLFLLIQPFNGLKSLLKNEGREEKQLGKYLQEIRPKLLSPERQHEKLILFTYKAPEPLYWSDQKRLYDYAATVPPLQDIQGADIIIIPRRYQTETALLLSGKKYRQISSPCKNFFLFVPMDSPL